VYRYRIPTPVLTWLDDRHITTVIAKPPPFIHQVAGTSYLLTECISDLHLLGRNIGTVTRARELDARDSPRIVGDYAGLSQHINVLTVVMCLPFMNLTRQYIRVYSSILHEVYSYILPSSDIHSAAYMARHQSDQTSDIEIYYVM